MDHAQKKALSYYQECWIRSIIALWEQQSVPLIVYQESCEIWLGVPWTHLRDTKTNGYW